MPDSRCTATYPFPSEFGPRRCELIAPHPTSSHAVRDPDGGATIWGEVEALAGQRLIAPEWATRT